MEYILFTKHNIDPTFTEMKKVGDILETINIFPYDDWSYDYIQTFNNQYIQMRIGIPHKECDYYIISIDEKRCFDRWANSDYKHESKTLEDIISFLKETLILIENKRNKEKIKRKVRRKKHKAKMKKRGRL